jgi:chlorite dismutase
VWVFNVEGTLDLFNATTLATLRVQEYSYLAIYRAQPYMGPAYWIPAFWVPALLVTHYITFVFLWKHWKAPN